MTSGTQSCAPSAVANDFADTSVGSEGEQSMLELPEHNENYIYHDDKTYKRRKARPAKKRARSPNTWYWKHGEEISEGNQRRWKCEPCWMAQRFTHYAQTSNKAILGHLKREHDISPEGPANPIHFQVTPANDNSISIVPTIFDWQTLKIRFIEWIVVMHITFSQIESDWFRRFLAVLSPSLAEWIPKAGNTVKAWVLAEFEERREDIKKELHASKSRIHLSFDLWTSPNHMSFVGVVGHFMSSQYKVETVLLGLRRLRGPHSGENIAEAVLKVIRTYGLTGDRIGWFVLDNATSNDTCVAEILKALDIKDTVRRRRLRCLGHIINLAAKAFLFGPDPNAFENEVQSSAQYQEDKKEREIWRKRGPIGKLHNITTYIRTTPQRREEFEEKVSAELERQKDRIAATARPDEDVDTVMKEPLMVVQDNQTRWNSVFCMIQRALLLKDPLDLFVKRAREKPGQESPLPKDDELSANDWNILARTRDILKPFFDLTLRLQSRARHATHGSIWEALPTLDFLLNELEVKSKVYGAQLTGSSSAAQPRESAKRSAKKAGQQPLESDIAHISTSIDSCWAKLRKYYSLMDESPVYAAAVVLNPDHKWDYFKTSWEEHADWITKAEQNVEDLWNTMYKDSANSPEAEIGCGHGLFLPTL